MRSLEEALGQFAYHPATADTAPRHARIRDLFAESLTALWDVVPDGPEKTLAVRKLQESAMYANLAVALTAPADLSEARSVARVLPEGASSGGSLQPMPDPYRAGRGCGCVKCTTLGG